MDPESPLLPFVIEIHGIYGAGVKPILVHQVLRSVDMSQEDADIAVLPGFDRGVYRAKFPGLSSEEENEVFTQELSNIVIHKLNASFTSFITSII